MAYGYGLRHRANYAYRTRNYRYGASDYAPRREYKTGEDDTRKPSDKQVEFLRALWVGDGVEQYLADGPTRSQVSAMIDDLAAQKKARQQEERDNAPKADEGYYVENGTVYVVVTSKSSGRPYAKRLMLGEGNAKWEYAPGVAARLATMAPLTVEEAARLGHLHGVCHVCGRRLTEPKSVDAGIGPVCIKKLQR